MANKSYTFITSSVNAGSYTGSISKVLALGVSTATASLSRIEFGLEVQDFGKISSSGQNGWNADSLVTNVDIPAGSTLEGPMGRIEVGGGRFLIYFGSNEYFD